MISGLIRTARPKQWLKNVLVFAAPGAAGVLSQGRELGLTIIVFVAFCFAASAVYYWNDLIDVTADRMHPTKRDRPIA
ncbi:MAG: decaprenyl-phosphate phosphoribosyltransferase, partial [Ilumatobacter sp.]|nr:decaprenyl-phosphate phosphoribosyltransferase [Ilumatobacter sp.]